jgi:hypothetical protein
MINHVISTDVANSDKIILKNLDCIAIMNPDNVDMPAIIAVPIKKWR